MNLFNFLQIGGYPLETDTLDEMQKAYRIFNALGALAGDKTIVSGCETTGGNVSDGFVYLNGELFEFVGGVEQSTVRILETTIDKEFENGETKTVLTKRVVSFASGTGAIPWADFKRAYSLTNALVIDEIKMYAGNLGEIPTGWYLCDGQNGTVDLRGKFIVGYNTSDTDYDAIGKTGGSKEVTLTEAQMPLHDHTGTTSVNGEHTHKVPNEVGGSGGTDVHFRIEAQNRTDQDGDPAGDHSHTLNINDAGGDEAHENRPPYYTLAYIQFKGI